MTPAASLLIDTDPGTDDALALLLAAAFFRDRDVALLSSYGNTVLSHTHRNLVGLTALFRWDVPVFRGAALPLGNRPFTPTDYHGENGLCGVELPDAEKHGTADANAGMEQASDGLAAAAQYLLAHPQTTYIALGPLTNLARLFTLWPDAASSLREVVIMGGGLNVSNVEGGAEYNFSMDPAAVETVLSLPLKKTLAPLDLTHTLAFSAGECGEIVEEALTRGQTKGHSLKGDRQESGTPFRLMTEIFLRNLSTSLAHGNSGALIHDASTLAYLLDPTRAKTEEIALRCGEGGRLTRVSDVMTSHSSLSPIGGRVTWIAALEKPFLRELLTEALARLVSPADCLFPDPSGLVPPTKTESPRGGRKERA